jgi:hypothetical protein
MGDTHLDAVFYVIGLTIYDLFVNWGVHITLLPTQYVAIVFSFLAGRNIIPTGYMMLIGTLPCVL